MAGQETLDLPIEVRILVPESGQDRFVPMVTIAQVAEHLVVAQEVVGSSPTGHPVLSA